MKVIVANILGLISALILIYAGSIKEKKKVIKYQTIHSFFGMSCDLLLGGYPSVISNVFTITRNILAYKNKFTKILMIIFIIAVSGLFDTFTIITAVITLIKMIKSKKKKTSKN